VAGVGATALGWQGAGGALRTLSTSPVCGIGMPDFMLSSSLFLSIAALILAPMEEFDLLF
jgi:hypothetical protein